MRKVTLISCRDTETDMLGLKVKGLSVSNGQAFVATEGLLIAHDLLEHQNGVKEIGGIDDELEALGGAWFIRGQFDDLSRDRRGSMYSPAENLASDIANMFRNHFYGEYMADLPITRAGDHEESFKEIIEHARNSILCEIEYEDEADRESMLNAFPLYLAKALARLRIGFRKARRRYKGDAIAANRMFWNIADAVDPYAKHVEYEGQELKLSYDDSRAYCEEIYEDDYE